MICSHCGGHEIIRCKNCNARYCSKCGLTYFDPQPHKNCEILDVSKDLKPHTPSAPVREYGSE